MNTKQISWPLLAIKTRFYSISECLVSAVEHLSSVSDSARIDAEILLAHVLEKDRTYLFTWPEKTLNHDQHYSWQNLLARRIKGEPVAYILGQQEFWSLNFFCDASTLIPRPDTEIVVEQVITRIGLKPATVLDLGTGTGAIAIAIAKECPACRVDAVDRSEGAVHLAMKNKRSLAVENVNVYRSDWFSAVSSRYDIIVSNPPYISMDDEHLQQGDVRFEPQSALVAEDDGLADLRHIIFSGVAYLQPEGCLMVEHGWKQGAAVQALFAEAGYREITTVQDYSGNDRVTMGCKG